MAIAVSDELQEHGEEGSDGCVLPVGGRLGFFLQITARADVPWSDAWRGSRRSIDTNRCHRASRCALQVPRMAIAVPDDICRKRGQRTITICGNGENRCTGGLAPIKKESASADCPGPGVGEGMESELAPTEPSQTYTYQRSNFVHKNVGFHGQNGISSGFVHGIGPFHGQNRVNRSQ